MAGGPKARRAAALKAAKTRADRLAQRRAQAPPLTPQALRPRHRRANTLGEDEEKREEKKEEARRAHQLERDQVYQVAARAAERQRMEDELRGRVEAAERAAAAARHPNLEEDEEQ